MIKESYNNLIWPREYPITRFIPTTLLCLSEARIWISNAIYLGGVFFSVVWSE